MLFSKKKSDATDIPEEVTPTPTSGEFTIHVMPREFYGKEATPPVTAKPVIVIPATSVALTAHSEKPIAPLSPSAPKTSVTKVLIIVGVIFLLCIVALAYFFLRPPTAAPTPTTTPIVTPTPEPTPVSAPEPEPTPAPVPTQGNDTDSDGLTDIEEALYKTDFRNPDSDRDTYLDGNEVFHGYDPNTVAPSRLIDTGSVKVSLQTERGYQIMYPATWRQEVQEGEVVYQAPDGSKITIAAAIRLEDKDAKTWATENDKLDASKLIPLVTKGGYYGVTSNGELTTYLEAPGKIFVISYTLPASQLISYLQTYQMMVNTFAALP